MSEEKLTVAELMARAGREVPAADKTRRRRRRSLDEGGISVADLTDGFSRIEADGPRRGAHAADDSEVDEQETPATEAVSDDATAVAQAEALAEAEAQKRAAAEAEAVAQAEAEALAAQEAEAAAVAKAEAEARAAEEAEAAALAQAEAEAQAAREAEAEAAAKAEAEARAAEEADAAARAEAEAREAEEEQAGAARAALPKQPEGFAAGVPQAVPVNPVVSSDGYSDDEVTYTFTAFLDSETVTSEVADPGPTAREMLDGFSAVDEIAPVPVFGFDPATVAAPEVEVEETPDPEPTAPAEFDREQTSVIPLVDETAEAPVDEEIEVVETVEVIDDDVAPAYDNEPEYVEVEETVEEYVEAPDDALLDESEPEHRYERAARDRDQAAYADTEEDNTLSVPLLILQVFVGVIAGVFLFMLFAMLWSGLPTVAMVLIGLVVTGVFVLVASKLRRETDRLTPILAGVVGLALTFGPFLIQLV